MNALVNRRRGAVVAASIAIAVVAGCSAAPDAPSHSDQTAANKKIVTDFYDQGFVRKDIAGAAQRFIGDTYLQHNPHVVDGREAFVAALSPIVAKPGAKMTVARVIAEGDLVVVHALSESLGKPATAVADVFRVSDGKIVEHWDVQQAVPDKTASGRPMVVG